MALKKNEGQISIESQIRMKLMSRGVSELTNAELLALVMGVETRDFSPAEVDAAIEAGFSPLTLGDSRLRTETAAVAAVAGVYFMI